MRALAFFLTLVAAAWGIPEIRQMELSSDIKPVSIPRVMNEGEFARAELAIAVRSIPSARGIRPKFLTH